MTLELEKLITEIRQDYQIPPYFQDTGLMRYLEEGKQDWIFESRTKSG